MEYSRRQDCGRLFLTRCFLQEEYKLFGKVRILPNMYDHNKSEMSTQTFWKLHYVVGSNKLIAAILKTKYTSVNPHHFSDIMRLMRISTSFIAVHTAPRSKWFKGWLALSAGKITIQLVTQLASLVLHSVLETDLFIGRGYKPFEELRPGGQSNKVWCYSGLNWTQIKNLRFNIQVSWFATVWVTFILNQSSVKLRPSFNHWK